MRGGKENRGGSVFRRVRFIHPYTCSGKRWNVGDIASGTAAFRGVLVKRGVAVEIDDEDRNIETATAEPWAERAVAIEPPVKRRRGRPRKYPIEE